MNISPGVLSLFPISLHRLSKSSSLLDDSKLCMTNKLAEAFGKTLALVGVGFGGVILTNLKLLIELTIEVGASWLTVLDE
jgi:hypothetical protein